MCLEKPGSSTTTTELMTNSHPARPNSQQCQPQYLITTILASRPHLVLAHNVSGSTDIHLLKADVLSLFWLFCTDSADKQ